MRFDRFTWLNAWVDDESVGDELMAVLIVLYRYMSSDGICYPTQDTIAHHIGRSVRTVQRRIQLVEKLGYIQVWGAQGSNKKYRAAMPTHDTRVASHTTPVSHISDSHDDDTRHPCRLNKHSHDTRVASHTTPVSHSHDTRVALTDQEQTKNRSDSVVSTEYETAEENSSAAQPFDPSAFISELLAEYGLSLPIPHIAALWSRVRFVLDAEQAQRYLVHKIADISLVEPRPAQRQIFDWLGADAKKWAEEYGRKSVGRNDYQAQTDEPTHQDESATTSEPEVIIDTYQHPPEWASAIDSMRELVTDFTAEKIAALRWGGRSDGHVTLHAMDEFDAIWLLDNCADLISAELRAQIEIITG